MDDKLTEQIARQIEAAFANTPYPGDENISNHEREDLDEDFKGKHWRDIPPKSLFAHRSDLGFFTTEAFRFYLPAFVLGVLRHFDEVDTLTYNLIAYLCPDPYRGFPDPPKLDYEARLKQRTVDFTPDQAAAVQGFLKAYQTLHPERFEGSAISILLDSALPFWEAKIKDNAIKRPT